jgi:hypothetical protein
MVRCGSAERASPRFSEKVNAAELMPLDDKGPTMPRFFAPRWKAACRSLRGTLLLTALLAAAPVVAAAEPGVAAGPPRAAMPDAALLKKAETSVREAHRKELAKAKITADRLALAQHLLDEARAMKKPSPACCATLILARTMAAELGNPELMDQAIDALAERFEVDAPALKKQTLIAAAMAPRSTAAGRSLAAACLDQMDTAATAEQYDAAMEYARAAYAAAGKAHDPALVKDVVERGRAVLALQREAVEVQSAQAILAHTPDDRQANLTCGRYACLVKNDWSAGLPMLARGNDPAWQKPAQQELSVPATAVAQVELAQQWAGMADTQSGVARAALVEHAARWYRKALAGLTGAEKAKVLQRLLELKGYARVGGTGVSPVLAEHTGKVPAPPGQWIDVLSHVDPARDTLSGKWKVQAGKLEALADSDTARLVVPLLPHGDYDLEVKFTRTSHGALGVVLPIAARQCLALIGYQGGANGLDTINGVRADSNASTFQGQLNNGRSYVLNMAVRIDGDDVSVTITLDDRPWIFYRGPTASLSLDAQWKLQKLRSLGLLAQADVVFQSIRLRSASGQVTGLR